MRVALDEQIFAIQRYGGISRMFAELALQFTSNPGLGVDLAPLSAPVVNRYVLDDPVLTNRLHAREAKNEWSALARYLTRLRKAGDAEVIHNTFYLPHGLTPSGGAARVVTIHDMIPELMPHTRRRLDRMTLKRRYVDSADHIICVSEASKQDLLKVYGIPSAPVSVVHHGVDPRFHPDPDRPEFLPQRYLLFVGHRGQYKDADVLFRAFSTIASREKDLSLVCVGGNGFSEAEVKRLVELGVRERVSQHYLSDEDMVGAYAYAELFVFPSHFEGFGLPALEAMACGTPAVLAAATSLPEVGADAAAYFEPGDSADLAGVILDLLKDEEACRQIVERGFARSASFTWEKSAELTAAIYGTAISRKRS